MKGVYLYCSLCLFLMFFFKVEGQSYSYFCTGNCSSPINVPTYGGVLLCGGGGDVDEVIPPLFIFLELYNHKKQAFKKFIQLAGGGNILIIRASGGDGYNEYLYKLEPCNSVETIVFHDTSASRDPFVLSKLKSASGIFVSVLSSKVEPTIFLTFFWGSWLEGTSLFISNIGKALQLVCPSNSKE